MRENYIELVRKALRVSKAAKRVVIGDLNEIFASALENGETEAQVIERLGSPEEFAKSAAEQLGGSGRSVGVAARWSGICILAAAAICFVVYGMVRGAGVPDGVIGQADAMTNIAVEGNGQVPLAILLLGIVAVVAGAIQTVRGFCAKWRRR